ncbi:sialidase-3-like [Polypterus senegalus]|uniref:sialidase-3-like n=1 Tax=Polypterus senegalus TaxID=55291 RepID=UPI0019638A95|nr:sialidase-3-like [Polypterus senegalus]XP_039601559.1 sialidase-3-like [Polypterus senegalus]XP_039601560.1 sialidase-3-like [Polypterus senegalus]
MAADFEPQRTTLFQSVQGGVTYRIPSLIYISDAHSFLAFAEKRSSPRDADAENLEMRIGSTFSGSVQWQPAVKIKNASLPGYRTMNPCPVYEKNTRVLYLFFICVKGNVSECYQICTGCNKTKLCYICSKDFGTSWSEVTDLTEHLIGNWATFAVGPGHGVQLSCGRLVIPAYAYVKKICSCFYRPCFCSSHSFSLFSDNNGQTWNVGEMINEPKTVECEMAEVFSSDGHSHLYCNARSEYGCRVEAVSENNGTNFGKPQKAQLLVEPSKGCQGSVVSFPAPAESLQSEGKSTAPQQSWLLYSHPTSREKRVNLGIYINKSPLCPLKWSKPYIIYRGPSGYSDLSYCDDTKSFACLFECGVHSELEEIAFVQFTQNEVINAGKCS